MSSQEDSRLIQEVCKYRNLYDPRTQDYKDRDKKDNSWKEIGYVLGIKPQDVKGRWRNLRDRFVREKKRLVTDGESAYSQRDPWPLLDDMSFLWEFITHRQERRSKLVFNNKAVQNSKRLKTSKQHAESGQRILQPILPRPSPEWVQVAWEYDTPTASPSPGGVSTSAEQSCIKRDPNATPTQELDDDNDDDKYNEDGPTNSKMCCVMEDSKQSTQEFIQDDSSEDMPQLSLAPEPHIQHISESTRDEDELFCLSVAASLRRFSAKKKAFAKLRIQQVLFEVEFQSTSTIPAESLYLSSS